MEPDRPRAVLVDMDGTLCDVRSIQHLVDGSRGARRNFAAFHTRSIDCPPHVAVVEALAEARAAGLVVVVVSAREARWSMVTSLWLRDHGIEYDDMFLRARGDGRPDAVVKRGIAARIVKRYEPVLALDDRPEIIAVWQDFGIPTRLVSSDGRLGELVSRSG